MCICVGGARLFQAGSSRSANNARVEALKEELKIILTNVLYWKADVVVNRGPGRNISDDKIGYWN
jgi:hypothetical protein